MFSSLFFQNIFPGILSVAAAITDGQSDTPLFYEEVLVVTGQEAAATPVADKESSALRTAVDLADTPAARLSLALDGLGGVALSSMGPGQRQSLTLRGASSQQLLLTYNDIPLNSPLGGGADLSLYQLGQVAAATVEAGADNSSNQGAMAGRVELSGHNLLDKELGSGAFVSLLAGSMNTWALNGLGRYQWQRGGAELTLGARRSDGSFYYVDDNGSRRERRNNDSRQFGGTFTLAQRMKGADRLAILAHATASQRGVSGPYQLESFTARQHDIKSFLAAKALFYPQVRWQPEITAAAQMRYELLHFADEHPAFGRPLDELDHVLTAGLTGRVAFSPHASQRLGAEVQLGLEQFWQNSLEVLRAEYLLTVFDHMDFIREKLLLDVSLTFGGKGQSWLFLPSLAGRYRFIYDKNQSKELALFVRGGRAGRFPSFYELYSHQDGLRPNADLRPEAVWDLSGGLLWQWRRIKSSLAFFYRWQKDMILFVPVTASLIEAQNFEKSRAYGLELNLDGEYYLKWNFSYTLIKTAWGDDGALELPSHPRHKGRVKIAYDIKIYEWQKRHESLFLTPWTQVGWQTKMALDRLNNLWEEGRALWSLGLDAAFPFDIHLSFWVENLLDKKDAVDSLQYPLAGRTFWITVSGGHKR